MTSFRKFFSLPASDQIPTYREDTMQRCMAAVCVCAINGVAWISDSELSVH